jgi:hypothetical protein
MGPIKRRRNKGKQVEEPKAEVNGLNENHIRTLSSTLSLLEKNIDEIERMLEEPVGGKLYALENDLDDTKKEEVRVRIQAIRSCIYKYAQLFDLKMERGSLYASIRGTFSMRWVDVCEMEPDSLRGYGEVGKDVYGSVMNCARELEELLKSI